MIHIRMIVKNIWNKTDKHKILYCFYRKISKYKNIEFQIDSNNFNPLFELVIDTSFSGRDHAGPMISLTVFGFCTYIQIYDVRHWDYDKHNWIKE